MESKVLGEMFFDLEQREVLSGVCVFKSVFDDELLDSSDSLEVVGVDGGVTEAEDGVLGVTGLNTEDLGVSLLMNFGSKASSRLNGFFIFVVSS